MNCIYVESTGKRYPAEITGPTVEVIEPKQLTREWNANEKREKDVCKPAIQNASPGNVDIIIHKGGESYDKHSRPFVNLRVNFGTASYPRFAPVLGVKLHKDLLNNYHKGFYEPLPEKVAALQEATSDDRRKSK